ncbi:MAG TPA: hypothetical protein GXX19_13760 [Syntrophomonadaceae bacterium]|nr:hypothetical protein [Syntrophomonadaceae bacterium]
MSGRKREGKLLAGLCRNPAFREVYARGCGYKKTTQPPRFYGVTTSVV